MAVNTTSGLIHWVVEGTLVMNTTSEEVEESNYSSPSAWPPGAPDLPGSVDTCILPSQPAYRPTDTSGGHSSSEIHGVADRSSLK